MWWDSPTFSFTLIISANVEKCVHSQTVSDFPVFPTLQPSLDHASRLKKGRWTTLKEINQDFDLPLMTSYGEKK